ncbi:MAG: OmpA family protein [Nitrospinota bacterium]|nr:OmpA family protein [Nitrospinota bacterium]
MAFNKSGSPGRRRSEESEEGTWMTTYSDMVTLLLAFFILLAAISVVDASKYEEVKAGLIESVSKKKVTKPFHELKNELDKMIKQENLEKEIMVDLSAQGIKLEFSSAALFLSGDAEIMDTARPIIDKVAKSLKVISYDDHKVSVEGHTDDVPINTVKYPSNWELSTARATNVLRMLIEFGIEKKRLQASGFADIAPKAPNRDELGNAIAENQMQNRRVVIKIHR